LFSNTGRTDLRLTEVQHPKTTATLSWSRSCLAFSANRSQFDAGSTTTGVIFLPMTPPLALISSAAMSTTSRSETSLMAIVPESECRTPILTVSCALSTLGKLRPAPTAVDASSPPLMKSRREYCAISVSFRVGGLGRDVIGAPPADVSGRRLASVAAKAVPEPLCVSFWDVGAQ